MKIKHDQFGISILEVIMAIAFLLFTISLFTVSISSFSLQLRSINEYEATAFAQAQLETFADIGYDKIPSGTDLDFVGFPFNHGFLGVHTYDSPPSGELVFHAEAASPLDNDLTSIILLEDYLTTAYTFEAQLAVSGLSGNNWESGPVFSYQGPQNYYQFILEDDDARVIVVEGGSPTELLSISDTYNTNEWYKISVDFDGIDEYTIEINDSLWGVVNDSTFSEGRLGVASYYTTHLDLDDVSIVSLPVNVSYDFDGEEMSGFPLGFINIAPPHLTDLMGSFSVTNPVGEASTKEVAVTVTWDAREFTHQSEIVQRFYEPYSP
jgi:hypothetical protein